MAQTGFTPISLYYSSTATNVPTNTNLAAGELAINTADGKLFYKDSSGVVQTLASKSTGTIGGSTTQIQYNNAGSFAGSANLTYDGTNFVVTAIQKLQGTTTILGNSSGVGNNSSILRFNGWNTGGANWQIDTANLSSTNELAFTPSTTAGGLTFTTLSQSFRSNGTIGVGTSGSTSGTGITFPATQSASSDANTLDDYEEGTWTPTIGGTATYSRQEASYTKIGRVVTVRFDMTITLLLTGSTTTISGLPFSVGNQATSEGYGATGYFSNLAINVTSLTCYAAANTSSIYFNSLGAAGATANQNPAIFGNSTRVQGMVTYFTT